MFCALLRKNPVLRMRDSNSFWETRAKSAALFVLKTSPNNTDALLVAGLASLRTGERETARKYLERGLQLSPGNADLAKALAQVAGRDGRWVVPPRTSLLTQFPK